MDIERKGVARRKKIRLAILIAICLALVPIVTVGLNRLKPAAPSVDRATVWADTVKRGPMDLQVRGLVLIRLFQQAPISSVRACHARPFQRMCASFNVSLLPKRRASTTWPPVAGLMASGAGDANTSALTPW
jgi:hypothetical protein